MAMADSHPNPDDHPTHRLVGHAPAMAALRAQIRQLAPFDTLGSPAVPTLLLQGETGTGKGLVARVIHDSGPRARGPFIEVNCAAIPESMLEAELFGFEPGAFTDAKRVNPGLFEAAPGGALLLDAGHQARQAAGAERTLYAVSSWPWLGGVSLDNCGTAMPTWLYWAT
jgi:DNA-binding NtrC family response regulator